MSTGVITAAGIQKKSLSEVFFVKYKSDGDTSLPKVIIELQALTQKIFSQLGSLQTPQKLSIINQDKIEFLKDANYDKID